MRSVSSPFFSALTIFGHCFLSWTCYDKHHHEKICKQKKTSKTQEFRFNFNSLSSKGLMSPKIIEISFFCLVEADFLTMRTVKVNMWCWAVVDPKDSSYFMSFQDLDLRNRQKVPVFFLNENYQIHQKCTIEFPLKTTILHTTWVVNEFIDVQSKLCTSKNSHCVCNRERIPITRIKIISISSM